VRTRTVAVAGMLVLSPAGCSSGTCSDPDQRPREVTRPEVPQAEDDVANLLVDIPGALPETTRVTVTFDSDLALDVEVPGRSTECATEAVSRDGYRVDPGPIALAVTTGAGGQEELALAVRDRPR
jgi:hypothetical protein